MRSPKVVQVLKSLAVIAVAMAIASSASAQTFTGGVRGAVRDANGVVPGVTVELVNESTGISRESVSNDQGEYNFAAVQPGTYTLKATLTGFKTYENTGVRISAQQFITLDITLEVGQLQETITVTGQAPLIDTSNASGGGVIDAQQLQTLPSGGRSAFLFAVTIPTVIASGERRSAPAKLDCWKLRVGSVPSRLNVSRLLTVPNSRYLAVAGPNDLRDSSLL